MRNSGVSNSDARTTPPPPPPHLDDHHKYKIASFASNSGVLGLVLRGRRLTPILAVTVLVLAVTLLGQPVKAASNNDDYIVTERNATSHVLSDITPGGTRTPIYTFAYPPTLPLGVAVDSSGNFIVTENGVHVLSKITPSGVRSVIYTFLLPVGPAGVAIDSSGNYIVAEFDADNLVKITPGGTISLIKHFAVSGTKPLGVAIDSSGNYIVAEFGTANLVKITPGGTISLIFHFPEVNAEPFGVAIDSSGNYVVTELGAQLLSKITPGPVVRTILFTFAGGTGPAGVAIDSSGNYIITELGKQILSKLTPGSPVVRSVIYTFNPSTDPAGVAIRTVCISTAAGGATACAQTSPGVLSGFSAVSVGSVSPPPPSGVTFPFGLFSITVSGLSPGQTVTMTITLSAPLPAGTFSYWKFESGAWTQFPSASIDSTRTIITLTLTADSSGTVNDPGGPAIPPPPQPTHPLNVGGEMLPLNLIQVLGPWIAAMLTLTVVAVEMLVVRKKNRKP